jgi:hypothetical protein
MALSDNRLQLTHFSYDISPKRTQHVDVRGQQDRYRASGERDTYQARGKHDKQKLNGPNCDGACGPQTDNGLKFQPITIFNTSSYRYFLFE